MQAEGDVILFRAAEQAPLDFAAFFAEEHAGLFNALYFVSGNRADAAEFMQDAFLKLWERWERRHQPARARVPGGIRRRSVGADWSPDGRRIAVLRFVGNPSGALPGWTL